MRVFVLVLNGSQTKYGSWCPPSHLAPLCSALSAPPWAVGTRAVTYTVWGNLQEQVLCLAQCGTTSIMDEL